MTALWIILGIAAFFALVLSFSATVYVRITDEIELAVGAFGYRRKMDLSGETEKPEKPKKKPAKAKKNRRKTEKEAAEEKKKELGEEKPSEKSLGDTVEFILLLVRSFLPGAVRLLGRLRFTSVRIAMTVAGDEADTAAIRYGAVSAGVYNLLAAIDQGCTLRVKSVDILPDFVSGEGVYDISFKVKLRLGRILGAGIGMFFHFLSNLLKEKSQKKEDGMAARSASPNK